MANNYMQMPYANYAPQVMAPLPQMNLESEQPNGNDDLLTRHMHVLEQEMIDEAMQSNVMPNRKIRQAVLLHHGIDMSADSWFFKEDGDESKPLPILLYEAGYDVWLANNRGVTYSLEHEHLTHDDSYLGHKYWDFSFAEIGRYDIPAMVHKVKTELKEQHYYNVHYDNIDKILYMGYDQGAAAMLYSLAHNEYNLMADISGTVLMAPCVKMSVLPGK